MSFTRTDAPGRDRRGDTVPGPSMARSARCDEIDTPLAHHDPTEPHERVEARVGRAHCF